MGKLRKKANAKSHLPQPTAKQQKAIIPSQSDPMAQQVSRIGNAPNPSAHAAVLNRAPANQQSSNQQLLLQLQRQYGNGYVNQVLQLKRSSKKSAKPSTPNQKKPQSNAKESAKQKPEVVKPSSSKKKEGVNGVEGKKDTPKKEKDKYKNNKDKTTQNVKSDKRTEKQKKADLNRAISEVEQIMQKPKATPEIVKAKLPSIKSKYRLKSAKLEKQGENAYNVEVEINPKANLQILKNQDKVELVQSKEKKLKQEKERHQRLDEKLKSRKPPLNFKKYEEIMSYKKKTENLQIGLDGISDLIKFNIKQVEKESTSRKKQNWFVRKREVRKLRKHNHKYGGSDRHHIANIDIEAITQGLDAIEDNLVTTKGQAVGEFNQISHKNTSNISAVIKNNEIVIGNYITIKSQPFGSTTSSIDDKLQIKLLRIVRKIIQTDTGVNLISDLLQSKKDVNIFIDTIDMARTVATEAFGTGHGAKLGKPSGDPTQKGSGQPSSTNVFFNPNQKVDLSTKDPSKDKNTKQYRMPDDAVLFHELTHALRAAKGQQDLTKRKQRKKNSQGQEDMYTKGAWKDKEEEATVKAETEYLKQIGFPVKRIMYGKLATRIDK